MSERPQGEKVFEFEFDHAQWRCELFDRGPKGVEAQIFRNDAFRSARLCESRELARQWAVMERAMIEYG